MKPTGLTKSSWRRYENQIDRLRLRIEANERPFLERIEQMKRMDISMKLTKTVVIAFLFLTSQAVGQTVLDFTGGIPAGVEPKQASGSIVYYPPYKCCHVYGEWMLPITIQQGERVEIDLNPRYETAGGILVNGVKRAVTRSTVSPVVITATGTIGLYGGNVGTDNRAQWRQVRYWPNPTPTPTETPTATATETPTATATIQEATEEIIRFYFDDLRSGWRWEIKATRRLEAE